MATPYGDSNKSMKRLESRKSHSWWWDSHISPKNSKWLSDNLEEMDRCIKRMLKLVEEDGDSFAKKADMYYQKRPELIAHIEEFYRLYRSLAERYDHVTGELRKNVTSDLQSMGSCISDIGSELPSAWSSPDLQSQRLSRRKSGPRAAGFDFFLGPSGNNFDNYQKEVEDSPSLTGSELESDDDDSSVNNYSNGGDQRHQRKIIELEIELREVKEMLRQQQEDISDSPSRASKKENSDDLCAKIAEYEQELKNANEKLRASKEQIFWLNNELKRYRSSENGNASAAADLESSESREVKQDEDEVFMEANETSERPRSGEFQDPDNKIEALVEELRITKDQLQHSEKDIASLRRELENNKSSEKILQLQRQLDSANKDIASWQKKFNTEKREVAKLQERIARLKTSLSDRDHEVMDLKIAVSDAEEKIFPEKAQVKAEISRLYSEQTQLEEQIRDWESRGRSLEDEIRMIKAGKCEMEEKLTGEIEQLKAEIHEMSSHIGNLNTTLGAMRAEGEELRAEVVTLKAEVSCRHDKITEMDMRLQQLNEEQVKLVSGAEEARKTVEELTTRTKELEDEIQRQSVVILEGAEEKREAIRQLCFSLEHYRIGYHRLRQACRGYKRVPVLAS